MRRYAECKSAVCRFPRYRGWYGKDGGAAACDWGGGAKANPPPLPSLPLSSKAMRMRACGGMRSRDRARTPARIRHSLTLVPFDCLHSSLTPSFELALRSLRNPFPSSPSVMLHPYVVMAAPVPMHKPISLVLRIVVFLCGIAFLIGAIAIVTKRWSEAENQA